MTLESRAWLVFYAFTFAFVLATPLAAQNGPPTFGVEVQNTTANPVPVVVTGSSGDPVPVVVTGGRSEQLIIFKTGYQVPAGKRLLVDDVSVSCFSTSALPIAATPGGVGDFERFGISSTAVLRIAYSLTNCPETPSSGPGGPRCPEQDHVVGTAQTNGTTPAAQTSQGKGLATIGAGRQITAFADQGATLSGFCYSGIASLSDSFVRGTGRLIDPPNPGAHLSCRTQHGRRTADNDRA